jgi:cytosine/adenosine deaminase-related metal-dependent hydrolase
MHDAREAPPALLDIEALTEEARDALLLPADALLADWPEVRLDDADAGRFLDGMSVMANGGRITAVAPTAAFTAPADVRRIDGSGKTLVPGLWDSHKHFDSPCLAVCIYFNSSTDNYWNG